MESWSSRTRRWLFNFLPAFRSTGAWITYVSHDLRTIKVKLKLFWRTRNYVGTMYGGALYSSVDGIPMVMLIELLGKDYVVWDKSAEIRFLKPGRGTLTSTITVPVEETDEIRRDVAEHGKIERHHRVEWIDEEGDVVAVIDQVIHIHAKRRQ